MKRIAGFFNFLGKPVDRAVVKHMLDVSVNQPHDGQETWVEEGIGIGCTRKLNVSDLVGVRTSLLLSENQCSIVFDGRIDNRKDLFARLELHIKGSLQSITNEELVLAAYLKWEQSFLKYLLGDFSFAIWDKRKCKLICARDHFGSKPLYYALTKEAFVFASTPNAILASKSISPQVDSARIADFLVNRLEGIDKTCSFYRDMLRLPPAHVMFVSPGGVTLERYWEPLPASSMENWSEPDYLERFKELFEDAVRCRLIDLDLPAAMLSGGMDSSSIVGMGRKVVMQSGKDLHVFAAISNSLQNNRETSYINSVLNQGNVRPHLIVDTDFAEIVGRIVNAIELETDPFDCFINLNRGIYTFACDLGIHAILDGVDGDILLSDSGNLISLWMQRKIQSILDETIWASGLTVEYGWGKSDLLNSFVSSISPHAPDWMKGIRRRFLYRRFVKESIREGVIDHEFADEMRIGERFARLYTQHPNPAYFTQMEFHKIDLGHTDLTMAMERYERAAGFFNIEARHPLLDIRLVEYCLGLPWHLKTWHGWTKILLRRAMEQYLPPSVIWRSDKDTLMWEYNRLILKNRADYFYQVTLDERENIKPYVDIQKLEKFWREYLTDGIEDHAVQIWSSMALAFWLRRHRNMVRDLKLEH
jgi:asparagine synthase (glutamine-hydrolysing)